jgi:hypothetical protein
MNLLSKRNKRGAFLLEFGLVTGFVLVPLLLGVSSAGMTMVRTTHVYQLNRDMAHMFANGVDFTVAQNQALAVQAASGLDITVSGGNGVIILSQIECTGAGQAVCIRRQTIGNTALRSSSFANPTQIDSDGNVSYTTDPNATANSFLNVMNMSVGQIAYVSEMYYSSSDYNITGFLTGNGTYTYAVF